MADVASPEKKEEKKESPSISVSDVNRVIEELNKLQEERTTPLSSQPTPQPQKNQAIPNIPNVPNRPPQAPQAARAGARLAGQAGRLAAQAGLRLGAFLFTTPPGWVILGVGLVFIITFAIVFSIGGGGSSSQEPSVTPTPAGL